ncbi:hypothetical protein [Candidatus Nitrosotenuis aquarius]|uniref:hypothetical protein n=1 Tax=Candidatus Nitrosotenuis aquarius TaxID=1846278 RepID=UPI000C1E87D1|nr:hypothetical protein [Candidatus Nitrosotenuis aquarius]
MADENFVDMCAVCKQGVPKETMVYQKGRVFHPQCFESQGSTFPAIDPDLAQLSAKTRVELVQMKNLKARADAGLLSPPKPKAAKKKSSKKAKKKTKNVKKTKSKKSKPKAKRSKKRASKRRQ